MIELKQRIDGLVEINTCNFENIISCTVSYSLDGTTWKAASLYRSVDTDYMLDGCDWRYWNYALEKGVVKFKAEEKDKNIYWNKYINIGLYSGCVYFQVQVLTENGLFAENPVMMLEPEKAVYFDDWAGYIDGHCCDTAPNADNKWIIKEKENGIKVITAGTEKPLPGIMFSPGVEGEYDVYVCLESGTANFYISTSECEARTRFMTGGSIKDLYSYNFCDKHYKEIKWKTLVFNKDTKMSLAQIIDDRDIAWGFGSVAYIKLVPCRKSPAQYRLSGKYGNFALYLEPYSSAAVYGMLTAADVREVVEDFLRLSPSEITCQVCRIGSKTLHNSGFLQKFDVPVRCDDKIFHNGPARVAGKVDVLRVVSDYLRDKDTLLTVNLGVNTPYLWNKEISEGFVQKNMDKIKNGLFDYSNPEVMNYALRIVEELVSGYAVDGVTLDFMRNDGNQTKDTLVEFIRKVRDVLDIRKDRNGERMKLSARVPAERPEYYEAAGVWVRDGLVDVIVPSNSTEMYPIPRIEHYVNLCKNTGTKVYGCIDGWGTLLVLGQCSRKNSPLEIRNHVKLYRKLGAEGIFVYQGENYVFNPFINNMTFRMEQEYADE